MRLQWSSAAQRDLVRLRDFLRPVNPAAANRVVRMLVETVARLPDHPRMAPRVETYEDRDIRSLRAGDYNLHYEIRPDAILIVRIWHVREDR